MISKLKLYLVWHILKKWNFECIVGTTYKSAEIASLKNNL